MPPSLTPALQVDDLVVRYGQRVVVDQLSFEAQAGAVTAVLGPNGAGKTTTMECAEGLRTPTGGSISVLGHPPGSAAARSATGVMLQDGGLPQSRTTAQVLDLAASVYGAGARRAAELTDLLDLGAVLRTPVRRLSGGQRQRLAFAVAIVGKPRLAFLDEPSAGLDPHARTRVWDVVRSLREAGTAVVLTTHLLTEAESLADVVHIVADGKLRASGSPRELVAAHAGTDSLRVVLRRPLSPSDVADLTARIAPTQVASDGDSLTITDVTAPARTTAQLASWCAENDAPILTLHAGGGTLEHAYLALTGDHSVEEDVA